MLRQKIDVLVLDPHISGSDELNIVKIVKDFSDTRVLIFSAYPEPVYAVRYLLTGAVGFLHKGSSEAEIKKAFKVVLSGKNFLSHSVKDIAFSQLSAKRRGASTHYLTGNLMSQNYWCRAKVIWQ